MPAPYQTVLLCGDVGFEWHLCGVNKFMCMAVYMQGSNGDLFYDSGVTSNSCRGSQRFKEIAKVTSSISE